METANPIRMYPILTDPKHIPGGYYIKAKCIQNSAIAQAAPHVREIWDYLLKEANYADKKTYGITIKRGQLFTDYNEIAEALSWKEGFIKKRYKKHHVDYAMRWLRQELMITTHKTTRGLIITVCKYDTYQNAANYEKENDYDTVTTRLRQPTSTITKELKELKEEIGAEAPKQKSFKQWNEKEFGQEIAKYADLHPKERLRAFFDHWKEKDAKGKMLFQFNKTWETKSRLEKWARNEEIFSPNKSKSDPPKLNTNDYLKQREQDAKNLQAKIG